MPVELCLLDLYCSLPTMNKFVLRTSDRVRFDYSTRRFLTPGSQTSLTVETDPTALHQYTVTSSTSYNTLSNYSECINSISGINKLVVNVSESRERAFFLRVTPLFMEKNIYYHTKSRLILPETWNHHSHNDLSVTFGRCGVYFITIYDHYTYQTLSSLLDQQQNAHNC